MLTFLCLTQFSFSPKICWNRNLLSFTRTSQKCSLSKLRISFLSKKVICWYFKTKLICCIFRPVFTSKVNVLRFNRLFHTRYISNVVNAFIVKSVLSFSMENKLYRSKKVKVWEYQKLRIKHNVIKNGNVMHLLTLKRSNRTIVINILIFVNCSW